MDNIASSLLFGDGSAAALVVGDETDMPGLNIGSFYSEIIPKGKRDMSWELSSNGFLMTLSGYVPDLIEEDFSALVEKAMQKDGLHKNAVTHWCIHPGGKRILEGIQKSLGFSGGELSHSWDVLREFGNLSSATILFVLKQMMQKEKKIGRLFGAAFGPGLTVETFTAHT
jgi:predicted naringenin-chalcone synthase